jgi:hypothetical protein
MFITLLPIGMGEGNPRTKPLFALAHFHALRCSFGVFPSYLFPSLANGIHILGLVSIVSFVFDHFISQLMSMGLVVQPTSI